MKDCSLWIVAMLKGGVGKTKTVMFVATALAMRRAAMGEEVLIIDADPGTQGVTGWVSQLLADYPDYELPWHVHQWSPSMGLLASFIRDKQRETRARWVLVDLGSEIPQTVGDAARLADRIIMPVGTHQEEVARVAPTMTMIASAGKEYRTSVLLTRVDKVRGGAALELREELQDKYNVLDSEVPRNKGDYDRFGAPIEFVSAYGAVVDELLKRDELEGNAK